MSKATPVSVDIDDILATSQRLRPGGKCTVCAALADMPADWRAKFEAAIDDVKRYSAMSLVGAFEKVGVTVVRNSVERHRKRECLGRRGHA